MNMNQTSRILLLSSSPGQQLARWLRGAEGAMWDASKSNLDQSATLGTPIAASGDPVGYMADLSGRGYHMKQTTAESRPTYMESGDLRFLRFNGTSHWMKALNVKFANCTRVTAVLSMANINVTTSAVVMETLSPAADGGWGVYQNNGAAGAIGGGVGTPSAYVFNNASPTPADGRMVVSMTYDPAATSADARLRIRVNGIDIDESQAAELGAPASDAFALQDVFLGARGGTSAHGNFDLFRCCIIGRELSATEIVTAERWCASGVVSIV